MNWTTLFVAFALIIVSVLGDVQDDSTVTEVHTEGCPEANRNAAFPWRKAEREVQECTWSLFNATDVEEIKAAGPTARFNIGLRKYCSSSAELRQCLANARSTVDPCLTEAQKVRKQILANVTQVFLNFICDNDEARITQFIEGEGVECLTGHREDIKQCINETIRSDPLADSVLSSEGCKDLRALQRCVVPKLASCQKNATAEIAEAFINVIYEATPCSNPTALPTTYESEFEVQHVPHPMTTSVLGDVEVDSTVTEVHTEGCPEDHRSAVLSWGKAVHVVGQCTGSLINATDREEFDATFVIGLRRFCSSSTELTQCLANVTSTVDPCLTEAQKARIHIVVNITEAFLNFICDNDGARITQFIEEEGVECITEHGEDLKRCFNETVRANPLADSVLSSEGCKDLRALQRCVVPKLATCQKNATAEIVDAFINVAYEATPCSNPTALPTTYESEFEVPSDSISNTPSDVASETSA